MEDKEDAERKISRQYLCQQRKLARGECRTCGKKADTKYFCRKCADSVNLRVKKKRAK